MCHPSVVNKLRHVVSGNMRRRAECPLSVVIGGERSPAGGLLQHLEHTDSEGLVLKALSDVVLVDAELCPRDGLSLWDAGQVEAVLPAVLQRHGVLVLLH